MVWYSNRAVTERYRYQAKQDSFDLFEMFGFGRPTGMRKPKQVAKNL